MSAKVDQPHQFDVVISGFATNGAHIFVLRVSSLFWEPLTTDVCASSGDGVLSAISFSGFSGLAGGAPSAFSFCRNKKRRTFYKKHLKAHEWVALVFVKDQYPHCMCYQTYTGNHQPVKVLAQLVIEVTRNKWGKKPLKIFSHTMKTFILIDFLCYAMNHNFSDFSKGKKKILNQTKVGIKSWHPSE